MRKDILYLSIVVIIGTILRFLFSKPFPLDGDGFLFMDLAKQHIIGSDLITWLGYFLGSNLLILFLSILAIINIVLFYILCRQYLESLYSFIASLFFTISPLVFLNSYFGMVDKNILSIFMILIILLITKLTKDRYVLQSILIFFLLGIFSFVWTGWIYLAFIYFLYYTYVCFKSENKNIRYVSFFFILCIIILFIFIGWDITKYFTSSPDKSFIRELQPIWMILPYSEYVIFIFTYLLIIVAIKELKKEFFRHYGFELFFLFITVIGMIFVFRISLYAVIGFYLFWGIMLNMLEWKDKIKIICALVIFTFIILTSFNMYNLPSLYDPALKEAIDYTNIQNTDCIVGMWDKGTIYEYFSNKTALYKGYAAKYEEYLDYISGNKDTNCSIIYSNYDRISINIMLKHNYRTNKSLYIDSMPKVNFTYLDRVYYVRSE